MTAAGGDDASGTPVDATRVFEDVGLFADWDRDYYSPSALRLYDRAVAAMLDFLDPGPGAEVLDAGCGPGVHSIRVARSGHRVFAIDVSSAVLEEARRRAERAGVAGSIRFARKDLTRLDLGDASVSAAFSWGVVIHIPEIGRALDELARVLVPGGRLALQITNQAAWDHRLERLARAALRRPNSGLERLPFGVGCWYESRGEKLWVWNVDVPALVRHLAGRGLALEGRLPVELTHFQRRLPGWLRPAAQRANEAWFAAGLPAGPAATNLLLFRRR